MGTIVSKSLTWSLLACFVVVLLFPVLWLVLTSVKDEVDMFKIPPVWIPLPPILGNYAKSFEDRPLVRYILNSVIATSCSTLICLVLGSLAGYGFDRFRIRFKRTFMVAILSARMIPPIALVVPLFVIMRIFGLLDRLLALILAYSTFSLPVSIWLMKSYFHNLSTEMEDAAQIDGCSRIGAFFRIVFPISMPGVIATSVLSILFGWKDFLWALVFTYTKRSQTIPIGISTYITYFSMYWGQIAATGALSILPIFLFCVLAQKYIVEGLTMGAVK